MTDRTERVRAYVNGIFDRIIPLDREKWHGYVLPFHYVSHYYYDVEIIRSGDNFNVSFITKPFETPFFILAFMRGCKKAMANF